MVLEQARLIEECNSKKLKVFYQLNNLVEITGLSIRSLKYRMIEVKRKYENVSSLLYKDGKRWQIHYSIIQEFYPRKTKGVTTVYTYPWQTFATWNTLNNYDANYHLQVVKELKAYLGETQIMFAIERDCRGVNHTHLIADTDGISVKVAIEHVLHRYLSKREYRSDITPIINKYSSVHYLYKSPYYIGII